MSLTEFEEIALLDAWGEWEDATQEEIEAARKLPFNVRAYQQRGTAGQWLIPADKDLGMPESAAKLQEAKAMEVDEPQVIEIDETFDPSTTTPPGTDGRDQNNQAPVSAAGMEFVALQVPIPAEGDVEVAPPELTEEDELLVSNDPIDDEAQILEMLEPHIAAAELQGHQNVDQPDTPEEPDIVRLYTDEEAIPELEGAALRKFKQMTEFREEVDLAKKIKKGSNAKHAEGPPAKRTVQETTQEPKPKASKKSPEEIASSSDARPAGAEADAAKTPDHEPQPKESERPAGAVADQTDSASAKTAIKPKAMPEQAPKVPPTQKVQHHRSLGTRLALQARAVPGASKLGQPQLQPGIWLSRRVSGLLRGWEHTNKRNRYPPPAFQQGLWMEFIHVHQEQVLAGTDHR